MSANLIALDMEKLSRVTVVDETGRVYERYGLGVLLSIQDDGRTLKVFVTPRSDVSK